MKNQSAVSLGSLGGQARAKSLSKERLKEISREANAKRWEGHVKKK